MNEQLTFTVSALVIGLGAFLTGYFWRSIVDRKYSEKKEENAQKEAAIILDKAKKEAELSKKTAILEAKDEWFKAKTKFEEEVAQKKETLRAEQQRIK